MPEAWYVSSLTYQVPVILFIFTCLSVAFPRPKTQYQGTLHYITGKISFYFFCSFFFLPVSIFLELCFWTVKAEALGDFEEEGVGEPGLHWPCGRDLRWFSANSPLVCLIGF